MHRTNFDYLSKEINKQTKQNKKNKKNKLISLTQELELVLS